MCKDVGGRDLLECRLATALCWHRGCLEKHDCASAQGVVRKNGIVVLQRHVQDEVLHDVVRLWRNQEGGGGREPFRRRESQPRRIMLNDDKTRYVNNCCGQVWLKFLMLAGSVGEVAIESVNAVMALHTKAHRCNLQNLIPEPRRPDNRR